MPASVSTPADVLNLTLRRIGYKLRVSNLYDGSEAATAALDIYAQTRDDLLRDGDWDFAQRNITMTLLKAAPSGGYFPPNLWNETDYPPWPWLYSYTYPSDCLKVRKVKAAPMFMVNMSPQPSNYSVVNVQNTVSTLATLAVNAAGTGYVPGDYIYPSGGTQTTQAILQVASTKVVSATIAAAGTGGTPGAAVVTGTTGTGTKFTANVTIGAGGDITSVNSIASGGVYTVNPTTLTAEPVTGASLSGAQLSVVMGVNAITITKAGVFTTTSLTFTQGSTSGSGTGATFNTATYSATTQPQRVIVANIANAMLTYTGQVTDLSQWPPDAIEALAAALGRRLVPTLIDAGMVQAAGQDEAIQKNLAEMEQG